MQAPVTTADIHETTGIASGKLAIWWFLASEIVTFGGLAGSYIVVRLANPHWAEESAHLSVAIATFNTFILLTSSLTMVLAFEAIDYRDQRAARTWLFGFLTAATTFATPVLQALAWPTSTILIGNLLAIVAMGFYLWRCYHHPAS
jgi:heme/copper-type cytochrome/quinol oxidase subunit 3